MLEERYERMMEDVAPAPELVQRTLKAAQPHRAHAGAWKPVLIIALCVLMVAGAAAWRVMSAPDVSQVAAQPTPTVAPTPMADPSGPECSYDGMTLRYLSSWGDEEKLYVTLSVEGANLPEQLSISLMTDTGASSHARMISHDPEKHRAIFFADFTLDSRYPVISEEDRSIQWLNPVIDLSQPISLRVTGYTSYLCLPLGDVLPLDAISTAPPMQTKSRTELINGYDNKDFMTYCYTGYPVLVPGERLTAPVAGHAIVAAGFSDDRLHVLLTRTAPEHSDPDCLKESFLAPVLLPAGYTGNPFGDDMPPQMLSTYECFYWTDETTQITYQDYVFDHSREALLGMSPGMQLCLCGNVAFSLPDGAASPMSITFTLGE
ncbi:MAG: hypothetical protein IJE07_10510 [Clostridia bacterium]|nr:hypothetical protein [Clostridia bacterium]